MSKPSKPGSVSLASAALATAAACCHSAPRAETPPGERTAECKAMSREELDEVARAPRIRGRPEVIRKIDLTIWKAVHAAELAAEGQPVNFNVPKFPRGCVPAFIEVLIVHTGNEQTEQDMIAVGLHASFTRGNPYSFAVGYVSPARVAALASLPEVVSMTGADPVPSLELNDSIKSVRVDQVRVADPAATGEGVLIVIIDSGVDVRHGSFRLPDNKTRIVGIWDQRLSPQSGETPGPSGPGGTPMGVVYRRKDIDHTLGHPVTGPEYPPGPAIEVRHKDLPPDQSVPPADANSSMTTRNTRTARTSQVSRPATALRARAAGPADSGSSAWLPRPSCSSSRSGA